MANLLSFFKLSSEKGLAVGLFERIRRRKHPRVTRIPILGGRLGIGLKPMEEWCVFVVDTEASSRGTAKSLSTRWKLPNVGTRVRPQTRQAAIRYMRSSELRTTSSQLFTRICGYGGSL
ncbi:MAG: hypothetical protein GY696_07370 [Gammaproteobacteria bacterium]|nr:hypothetical protein [Gammaproteobacteria bacterium]